LGEQLLRLRLAGRSGILAQEALVEVLGQLELREIAVEVVLLAVCLRGVEEEGRRRIEPKGFFVSGNRGAVLADVVGLLAGVKVALGFLDRGLVLRECWCRKEKQNKRSTDVGHCGRPRFPGRVHFIMAGDRIGRGTSAALSLRGRAPPARILNASTRAGAAVR